MKMSAIDDLNEALETIARASRVILVSPDLEERARDAVKQSPFPGMLDVQVSPYMPKDKIFIIPKDSLTADGFKEPRIH